MTNLVVDIGNAAVKLAVFRQGKLASSLTVRSMHRDELHKYLQGNGEPEYALISSVRGSASEDIEEVIRSQIKHTFVLDASIKLPIKNLYETPETLGKDRLAAAVGAFHLYPNSNLLVIDAGTAITYEVVTAQGEYMGGNISPGLRMRFNALHQQTHKLPLCEPQQKFEPIGRNTGEAIVAGVQNGIIYETLANITKISLKYQNLKVVLTGGDASFLANHLQYPIFVVYDLVLIGLNRILEYHAGMA
ncbi:MAG: type III pantothenate kinase [Prevotellaceae bacterium]|jgi:type III pantothenate kinase|nr:type III pantothenate kinase [Prevotellaceae bacterium]